MQYQQFIFDFSNTDIKSRKISSSSTLNLADNSKATPQILSAGVKFHLFLFTSLTSLLLLHACNVVN